MAMLEKGASLTLEAAKRIAEIAFAEGEAVGRKINVAVCDNGGNPILYMRSTPMAVGFKMAVTKARSAVMTGMPTAKLLNTSDPEDAFIALSMSVTAGEETFIGVPGGHPVYVDGLLVGSVGIAGASANDALIAEKAATAIAEELK